jgi:hypothetical protein
MIPTTAPMKLPAITEQSGYAVMLNRDEGGPKFSYGVDFGSLVNDSPFATQKTIMSENFQISDTYLTTDISVGPTHYGAIVKRSSGLNLFLSDPSLPENTMIGPIQYAILTTGGFAFSVLSGLGQLGAFDLQQNASSMWPFDLSPYEAAGWISGGGRIGILQFASGSNTYTAERFYQRISPYLDTTAQSDVTAVTDVVLARQDAPSKLEFEIRAARKKAILEGEAAEVAGRAVRESCAFVSREIPNETPVTMIFDDGVVVLQWRKGDAGALLIFPGDGTATLSVKSPGGQYAPDEKEFSVSDSLPGSVRLIIEGLRAD